MAGSIGPIGTVRSRLGRARQELRRLMYAGDAVQAQPAFAPRLGPVDCVQGVARVGFDELCEQPLGAADYLKIAHEFHTLVIDRIPIMDYERRNEAKRFATLIDTLYEARARIVVLAAGEPETLYPAGDQAFEFERTASRLREMRAEGWGQ